MPNFVNRSVHLVPFPVLRGFKTIPDLVAYGSFWLIRLHHVHSAELGYKGNSPSLCSNPERSSWPKMSSHVLWLSFFCVIGLCASNEAPSLWDFPRGRMFWTCWPNMREVKGLDSGKTKVNLYNKQSQKRTVGALLTRHFMSENAQKLHYPDVAKQIQTTWFVTRLKLYFWSGFVLSAAYDGPPFFRKWDGCCPLSLTTCQAQSDELNWEDLHCQIFSGCFISEIHPSMLWRRFDSRKCTCYLLRVRRMCIYAFDSFWCFPRAYTTTLISFSLNDR